MGAEYCDERVCLSLCVFVRPELHVRPLANFFVHANYGRGSVLLWWRNGKLRISGSRDDVISAHKLRLLDVAARLRQRGSHAALGLARRNIHCRQWTLGTTSCITRPQ